MIPAEEAPRRAFSVAFRPEGVFLLGFRGMFRLDRHADVAETIVRLADRFVSQPVLALDPREFSLEPYPYQQWLDDGRQRASVERVENGWVEIPDVENEELWATFTTRFAFRRSVSPDEGPAIQEPVPSVTWSLSGVREVYATDAQQFRAVERRSREQLIQVLLGIGLKAPMYALELNHAGYAFDPSVVSHRSVDKWPVPLIPIHNYSLFVDPALSLGLFGQPWEGSICVFGDLLVERLARNPLACFGDVIRSSARCP
jgi:hypothetical protein